MLRKVDDVFIGPRCEFRVQLRSVPPRIAWPISPRAQNASKMMLCKVTMMVTRASPLCREFPMLQRAKAPFTVTREVEKPQRIVGVQGPIRVSTKRPGHRFSTKALATVNAP